MRQPQPTQLCRCYPGCVSRRGLAFQAGRLVMDASWAMSAEEFLASLWVGRGWFS